MSVKRDQIPVTSPCPITLDRSGVGTQDRELFCRHCSKDVHLLSHMTEREAREFMASRAGDDICVSYAVRSDGQIRFRPEPQVVPVASLMRRGLSMAASIGAAAFIAACTPHSDEHVVGEAPVKTTDEAKPDETKPETKQQHEPEVAGGITADVLPPDPPQVPCDPKDDIQVDGGLKAAPVELPPAPELANVKAKKPEQHVRGGAVARPIDDPLEL